MQHNIDKSKLGARAEPMVEAIEKCVHCGFCLSACPTYAVLGEEMDSPRGRIYLMKNVLEERITAADASPYIDRCLGCVGCVPACPSGVEYGELLMGYRAQVGAQVPRPLIDQVTRALICETLPYPGRFRLAVRGGKIGKLVESALPDKLGAMLGLIPDTLPASSPLPAIYPAKGKVRAKVALLSGCVQEVLAPEINRATLRVLAENGVETHIPRAQGCCGSLMMHIGEDQRAMQLAEKNLSAFPDDVDAIITNAAGCGSGMAEYPLLFRGTAQEQAAGQFAGRVKDISVFLDELGITAPRGFSQPVVAAYQDACHLRHAQGIVSAPRRLLSQIPNLTLRELNDGGLCCGSAGIYNLEQPQIAQELGQRKAQQIIESGADVLVSGNIGCLTQIESHLRQQGHVLTVWHTIQLLDAAYQGEDARHR
jgi:glycolate oxidase iron-sulfur subunit